MKLRLFAICLLTIAATCSAVQVPITILHTTDLHATILPTTDYQGVTNVGGFARCASMIKQIRSQEKNVLLVDAGDLYQGAAIGYLTDGAVMTRAINALKYDSWTLGNHEFDWGIEKIAARINEAQAPILVANIHHTPATNTPPQITEAFRKIRPFIQREIEGVKIGIVGLDTPGIPNWSRPRLIPGITLEDSVTALKRVIPQMKAAGCNVLVLVAHQGIHQPSDDHANQMGAITRAFPELDLIIAGHTHQLHKERTLNGVLYTQANYWGTYLGRVDLLYDTDQRKLVSKKADMLPMDSSVPLDPELMNLLKPDLDKTEAFLDTKLGEAAEPFDSRGGPKRECGIFNLLCASIAEAVRTRGGIVDAVLHGLLDEKAGLKEGPVTMRDVFQIVPYENTIGVAEFSRDEMVEVLEENAAFYSSGRFRGLWGMNMKLKISAPDGKRIVFLGAPGGSAARAEDRFHLACNSYDLASGGDKWKRLRQLADRPESRLIEYDFQTRDAVVEFVRKHSPLKVQHHDWWSLDSKRSAKAPRDP